MLVMFAGLSSINAQWIEKDIGSMSWFRSINFTNDGNGWIVGGKGTIYRTTDNGSTWRRVPWRSEDLVRDVYFSDKNTGWLLCERDPYTFHNGPASYLMFTSDGGNTWTEIDSPDKTNRMLGFVHSDDKLAFVVGEKGTTWSYNESLHRWISSNTGVSYMLSGGTGLGDKKWLLVGGGGTILRTENNGTSWETIPFPGDQKVKLNAVTMNDNRLCAVGNKGRIVCSDDLGMKWHIVDSGTTNDLFDIKHIGDGNMIAVGDMGTILTSDNNGRTWAMTHLKGKNRLEKIGAGSKQPIIVGFGKMMVLDNFD